LIYFVVLVGMLESRNQINLVSAFHFLIINIRKNYANLRILFLQKLKIENGKVVKR